ncbi:hypothetical protein D7C21_14890 [Salmonella enterica]|nr:hypothetical protein [Salmonella enterica]EBI9231607.1 hypothetical protein [Salmonella enterica]
MKIKISIDFEARRARADIMSWFWEGDALRDAAEKIGRGFFDEFRVIKTETRLRGLRVVTTITGRAKSALPGPAIA